MKFLDIVERSLAGPTVAKEDWDIDYVAMGIMDILEEFDLSYPAGAVIETDEAVIRRFYAAGRALASRIGVYHQDTKRIIRFTEEELDEAAASMPQSLTTGQGKDAFVFYARHAEDPRKPGVVAGNPGCPMDEKTFRETVESWAKEPSIDMVTCGSIVDVEGHTVRANSPSELLAVRHELKFLNEICAKVGRPYIGRLAAESSVSQVGDLAAMGPDGIRNGDAHLVALNNELITTNDNMIRAASSMETGVLNASLACVMVGGMAGNAAGATVCMIASMLLANLVCRADYHLCHPIHLKYIATSTRECMYLQSVTVQAFALCAPAVIICDIYPKSGAGTVELLREVAANTIEITVSGGHVEGVGSCDGLKPNCSGLEARIMGEVAAACARQGITREQGDVLIRKLLPGYESVFEQGNEGLPFTSVYNTETMEPLPEWQGLYEQVRKELSDLGLSI